MSVKVGDLLTATAAPVDGKPTPTRSWQWFRGNTAISGATGSTYLVQADDVGFSLRVRQIETNLMGVRKSTSSQTDIVQPIVPHAFEDSDWDVAVYTIATGGIETVIEQDNKYYRVHTFLESGNLNVTQGGDVEYLVVAGGGGGSLRIGPSGGGGGGQVLASIVSLDAGTFGAIVGDGGVGGNEATSTSATDGASSSFAGIVAAGGKKGLQDSNIYYGADGGESGNGNPGGDGGRMTIDGVNNAATDNGGGGGGDSAPGETATGTSTDPDDRTRPNGGAGTQSVIDGTESGSGGGGGGGSAEGTLPGFGFDGGGDGGENNVAGQGGTPNTGGGGGGAGRNGNPSGAGGSGIVIVRYQISQSEYEAEAT